MEVLIVGAGPTGLTCALVLAANGVTCRILERREEAPTTSRALGLQARSMELLDSLGVAEPILKVSHKLRGSSIMKGEREVARQGWIPPQSPFPYTYVFPQAELERVLRQRLEEMGVTVEWGTEVRTLEQLPDKIQVTLSDGRSLVTRWVVGADGARSRVRDEAGIAFDGKATGEAYYLADFSPHKEIPIKDAAMWLGEEGPLMLMQLPGAEQLWRIFVDVSDQALKETLPEPTLDRLQSLLDTRAFGKGSLRIDKLHWTSTFRTRVCLASAYRKGRIFIAGDAAHVFPPFGGQGMNTGIQDAFNLAWKLSYVLQGKSPESLLDTYEVERRPVGAATIQEVERRRKLFALRNPLLRTLRDTLLHLLTKSERSVRLASYANSQLGIAYKAGSWLTAETGSLRGPKAGERAPDGMLSTARLHTSFAPTRFTLLIFSGSSAATQPLKGLPHEVYTVPVDSATDPEGVVRTSYTMSQGGFVLVRPDGYIGFRGGPGSEGALQAYLERVLPGSFSAEFKRLAAA